MKTVWKFPLQLTDEQTIEMPFGSKILHVGEEASKSSIGGSEFAIWAQVNTSVKYNMKHRIYIVGTGQKMPDNEVSYIGTFISGKFVWHVFENLL